jgi:hypothetical protein
VRGFLFTIALYSPALRPTQHRIQWILRALSRREEEVNRWSVNLNNSRLFTADIKNAWSITSTLSIHCDHVTLIHKRYLLRYTVLQLRPVQEIFLFSTPSRPALGPTLLIQWVPGVLSSEVKRLGSKADHYLLSSVAKVKNMWSGTSTSLYVLMEMCLIKHRDNSKFTLLYRRKCTYSDISYLKHKYWLLCLLNIWKKWV